MKVVVSILVVGLLGGLAWWLMRPRRKEPPAHVQQLPGGRVPGPDTTSARPAEDSGGQAGDEAPAAAAPIESGADRAPAGVDQPPATEGPSDGDQDDAEVDADAAGTTGPTTANDETAGTADEPGVGDQDDGDQDDGEVDADAAGTTAATTADEPAAVGQGPYGQGSAAAGEDGSGPDGWTVKGNEDSKLYHTPESHSWEQTRAEVWFASEEAAEAAGFRPWDHNE